MLQKAAQELHCLKAHGLPLSGAGILVTERYVIVFHGNYAVVGYGNPVNIATQIMQHLFCLLEGWSGEYDPVIVPYLLRKALLRQGISGLLHKDRPKDR